MLCEKKEMHCSTGLLVLKLFLTSSFFLGLISSAYSLTHTEHHHAGRSCYHRRTAARNRHHSAARIRLHSSSTEGGARWSYCNPCHSDTCHSCKRELLTMIDEQQKNTFFPTPYLMVFFFMYYVNIWEKIFVCACRRRWRMWKNVEIFCRHWSSWHPAGNSRLRPQLMLRSSSRTYWYFSLPLNFSGLTLNLSPGEIPSKFIYVWCILIHHVFFFFFPCNRKQR